VIAVAGDVRVQISADTDIVEARGEGRALAARLGFSRTDATLIATAISEIGRNILVYAGTGEVAIGETADDHSVGIEVVARDGGPGIPDVELALSEGYATGNGLGLGLPGAKRLMDEFSIETAVGRGTTVTMRKWRGRDELERLRETSRRHA
jgi:anti-sigma regulatory factor (Ser/Thr protein kinase)